MADGDRTAGWYPDPLGRHELRYFDGAWTDQASTNGRRHHDPATGSPRIPVVECPPDLVRRHVAAADATDEPGAGTLRSEPVLVFVPEPSRNSNDFGIYDAQGAPVGLVREVEHSTARGIFKLVQVSDLRSRNLQVLDREGSLQLVIKRPLGVMDILRTRFVIKDADGRIIGQFARSLSHAFDVSCGGRTVAWIKATKHFRTNLEVVGASNDVLARITRHGWLGTAGYVLQFVRPVDDPLRSVLLTAPVVVSTARELADTFSD